MLKKLIYVQLVTESCIYIGINVLKNVLMIVLNITIISVSTITLMSLKFVTVMKKKIFQNAFNVVFINMTENNVMNVIMIYSFHFIIVKKNVQKNFL